MNKFLLSCFIALGFIGANAQILLNESFESGAATLPGFTTTNLTNTPTDGSTCQATVGSRAFGRALQNIFSPSAVLTYTSGNTSNGKKIDVSVNYQQWEATSTSAVGGNIKLEYAVGTSTTFAAVPGSTTITFSSRQNCMVISGTIPEGVIPVGSAVKVRVTTTRTSGYFVALYDAISIVQEATATPACTTYISPTNTETNVSVRPTITWNSAAGAEYYKIKIGTTAGASDVLSSQVYGTNFTPSSSNALPGNTLLFASVTPVNALGDALNCASEISFTTVANPFAPYCGPIISTDPANTYPISSVMFAGTTKTSPDVVGASAHEDFTSTIFELSPNTSNAITIVGNGVVNNRFATVVFVDWNNNGSFEDAGEKYFATAPFLYSATETNTLNGTIAVPANALLDTNLRMRIKYNVTGLLDPTSLPALLTDPCSDLKNGQVEDYTIIVKTPASAPVCTTFTTPVASSTDFPANGTMTWSPVAGAEAYKIYIGTTSGGTDIANGVTVNTASYNPPKLTTGVQYYAKVVPFNNIGSAVGCTEISFTAAGLEYCATALTTTSYPITSITLNGTTNTSTTTGAQDYEDFTSTIFNVNKGSTYNLSAVATGGITYPFAMTVFIDWNEDGDFNDENEKYFQSTLVVGTAATNNLSGEITVPNGVTDGTKRMRIKYANQVTQTILDGSLSDACNTIRNGQTEDYSVSVTTSTLNVSETNKTAVSVYPNPFQDVLNVSDVQGVKSITINDISGRQVKSMKVSNALNLSDLKAGLYIVNLHMEDGTVRSIKAIKK